MADFRLSDDELTRDPVSVFDLVEQLGEGYPFFFFFFFSSSSSSSFNGGEGWGGFQLEASRLPWKPFFFIFFFSTKFHLFSKERNRFLLIFFILFMNLLIC